MTSIDMQERALEVFQDKDIAKSWLNSYNEALGGKPIEISSKDGLNKVLRVLIRIEHGVYS